MNILHALTLAALAVSASACELCDGCFKAKKNKCTPATDIDKETCLNKNGRGQSVWCPDANEFASYELQTSSGKGFRARGFKPLTATRDSPAPVVVSVEIELVRQLGPAPLGNTDLTAIWLSHRLQHRSSSSSDRLSSRFKTNSSSTPRAKTQVRSVESRGDAAAATRILRGRRVAATPRLRRG